MKGRNCIMKPVGGLKMGNIGGCRKKKTATPALVGPSNEKVAATGHYGLYSLRYV